MVGVDDLKAYCNKIGRGSPSVLAIAGAVEFVKATNAWAYWLCPVCDKVFLDSNSFRSHVESKYIDIRRLQQLLRPTITKGSSELLDSDTWKPIDLKESEDEITMRLNYMKDAFSYLAVGSVDKEFKSTKDRAKRRRKKWVTYLDYHVYDYERDYPSEEDLFLPLCREMPELWEYLESCVDTKEGEDSSHSISLVQDGSALYLKREKFTGINMDGSPNVNPLFSWLRPGSSLEESVASWTSIRKKCVHDGNEVLKRIAEISDLLQEQLGLEHHSQEKTDSDFSITKVDSIEVEISHMSFEVSYLKKKLVKVCTFDYGIVILPLIRDYLRAKLTNDSPGKELHDRDDNGAAENSDDRHILIHEQYVVQEIPGTDSELDHQNSRTEEYENSSFSDSSDLSSIETESTSINSGVGSVHQITVDEPQFLNVTLRALWHLRRFHVFRMIPHTLHHLIVGECCIVCLLCEIFDAWDHNEEHKLSILLDNVGTAFSDILNDRNFDYKEYKNIAYEIISIIVDILHKSQKHYRWKTVEPDGITFEPYEINPSRCFGCCVAHEVLGLCFNEKRKCNCVSKSGDENRYSAIFHTIDVGAIQKTEMKSFSNIMEAAELDVERCRCGNKTEGCLSYPPHIFTTVFRWPTEKENYVDMSEVLINIAAPLDIPKIIYGVDMKHMYTLVTAVCCVEEEHLCFARGEGNWLIYESQKVEFADCWESLLRGYRGKNLRPQILFFEEVKRK
ncbi:uncharacterized protein LOC102712312 [Oryza brachyantha]|nr:uncharacterized protein LOC102712312 [Oryza brachyantha]